MGDQLLQIGNKIEMVQIKNDTVSKDLEKRVYVSQVLDMDGSDVLIAAMPIYEEKLIPLEIGTSYNTFFYTCKGIMHADTKILKRGKEGRIYVMALQITSEIKKYQRREFYRCACSVETRVASLNMQEAIAVAKTRKEPADIDSRMNNMMMVDISGGGVRLISKIKFEKNTYVYLKFPLMIGNECVYFSMLGKVIASLQSENNNMFFDNRIQFKEILRDERDSIIKYVFEQQRKLRRKERGM